MRFFRKDTSPAHQKIIIVGAGEVGFHIAQRLAQEKKQVVVIDKNPKVLKRLAEHVDVQTIQGSGSSPQVLEEAGLLDAEILLAVTDSDEINLVACFFANALAPDVLKLARIRNEEYTLYRDALSQSSLNIGMVINPEVEVVKAIDRMITLPGALEFNEFADGKIKLFSMRMETGPLIDVQLMNIREKIGDLRLIVAAIVRKDKLIIPSGQNTIREGDLVYFVCEDKDLNDVRKVIGCGHVSVRELMIIGGGDIGFKLAGLLEQKGYHTRIVDNDDERCQNLAEKLHKAIVLKGDGTDQDFLREENVGGMDVVMAMTGDEETNILSALLAKNMGAKSTITRINKSAYLPLVRAIGIEQSISPRLAAVNSILHYVRRGEVLSSISIKGEEAEALDAIAQDHSQLVGKPLMELAFPKDALLLCIMREDKVIVPTGGTVITPGDRIIILCKRSALPKVEKALEATEND